MHLLVIQSNLVAPTTAPLGNPGGVDGLRKGDKRRDASMDDVVRAKQIEIVDDEGRTRASLGMNDLEDGEETMVRLSMKDKAGITRLLIGITEEDRVEDETPFLAFVDSDGRPRISMVMEVEGDPSLTLTKADGSIGLAIHVGPRSTHLNIGGGST